jgi:mRNA-degrading endonuclease toxin of MazEF toxin-antitoxin module
MNPGEVHLARFPFGGTVGAKLRPVLLLTGPLGTVPEVLVAYITSVVPASVLPTDIVLDPSVAEHAVTGLKARSLLRLHKLATVHQTDLARILGNVSQATWSEVETRLRLLLNL